MNSPVTLISGKVFALPNELVVSFYQHTAPKQVSVKTYTLIKKQQSLRINLYNNTFQTLRYHSAT